MKTYSETIARLFNRRNHLKRKSLRISEKLSQIFDHPHTNYPTIHVAGTNGKGSVVTKIAAALQEAGWKTGLYTSPHLFDYEERIIINGKKIPKNRIVEMGQDLERIIANWKEQPNFFELTTCFAFRYFAEEKVDVAVIETGLGGRWDATNIIQPILSIITSISRDHINILGNTLEEIAAEKAGIIKQTIPVVLGPRAQLFPILDQAKKLSAPVHPVAEKGFYFEENCAIVKQALELLKPRFLLEEKDISAGLQKTIPFRFEKKGDVIFDVAHNPDGFAALVALLKQQFPHNRLRFCIGLSRDKEIQACLKYVAQVSSYAHFFQPSACSKFYTPEELGQCFSSLSTCPFSLELSVKNGLKSALSKKAADELVVVCGSFYIMREAYMNLSLSEIGS